MQTVSIDVWQKQAIKDGYNRVVVADDVQLKTGDDFKLEGKERKALHVQAVTTGYVYTFTNSVNGKRVNTSKRINAPAYIVTFEDLKNDTSGKATKAKELADKP